MFREREMGPFDMPHTYNLSDDVAASRPSIPCCTVQHETAMLHHNRTRFLKEIQYTMGDDHFIDVAGNSGGEPSKPCIFKVPALIRRHNPKSYTPNSFSFGPLYHTEEHPKKTKAKEEHLKETKVIKQHYLDKLLSRKPTPQTTLEEFKRSILDDEERARKCYAFPTEHLNKDEFVDMLVLDGCFIIELLRNNEKNDNTNNTLDEDDPVFSVSWVLQVLYHDLILLENQIPWFVLVHLFDMTTSPTKSGSTKSLTELTLHFFAKFFSAEPLPEIEDSHKSNHILDLLRNTLVSSSQIGQQLPGAWQQIPTAKSLKESGIRFKKSKSSTNFLDIKFTKHGVLEMPTLLIQDFTCEVFRNLISYEQCYPSGKPHITSYAVLLNHLVNTTKDIKVLCETGIVDNQLNLSDTVRFFNSADKDTYVKEFYYAQICVEVNSYLQKWWPAYMSIFWDPIGRLSLFAGGIALMLTLLQTLFTILQYTNL